MCKQIRTLGANRWHRHAFSFSTAYIERVIILLLPLLALSVTANIASAQSIAIPAPESLELTVVNSTVTAQAAHSKLKKVPRKKAGIAPSVTANPPSQASVKEDATDNIPHEKKHIVVKNETLWKLADMYYTDPFKWGRIYNANLDTVKNPNLIYPGNELNIPLRLQPAPSAAKLAPTAARAVQAPPKAGTAPINNPASAKNEESAAYYRADISEDMPEDQTAWPDNAIIASGSWRKDGKVTGTEDTDGCPKNITEPGDIVMLSITSKTTVTPGDTFKTYMKGAVAFNNGRKLGTELTQTGTVRVVSVSGSKAKARIISATTSVHKGQFIKK